MTQQQERQWGMLAHIIPLIAYLFTSFGWLAALVMYLVYKDKSKFVQFHALQQLYFMIFLFILTIIGVILFFTVIGIPFAILIWILSYLAAIVGPVYAAIKANGGEWWEYPIVGKYARATVA